MHIDIGAADEDDALKRVRVGDPVVIAADPVLLAGGRLVSRSLDNRLGAYVALEALRRVHERGGLKGGWRPWRRSRRRSAPRARPRRPSRSSPTWPLAVDVTHATDAPGVEEKELGRHPLGSGPVIGRGSTLSPRIFELLVRDRRSARAPQRRGIGTGTGTDADAIQISRAGIPAGLISIPLRYMHSPVEMVDLPTSRRRSS